MSLPDGDYELHLAESLQDAYRTAFYTELAGASLGRLLYLPGLSIDGVGPGESGLSCELPSGARLLSHGVGPKAADMALRDLEAHRDILGRTVSDDAALRRRVLSTLGEDELQGESQRRIDADAVAAAEREVVQARDRVESDRKKAVAALRRQEALDAIVVPILVPSRAAFCAAAIGMAVLLLTVASVYFAGASVVGTSVIALSASASGRVNFGRAVVQTIAGLGVVGDALVVRIDTAPGFSVIVASVLAYVSSLWVHFGGHLVWVYLARWLWTRLPTFRVRHIRPAMAGCVSCRTRPRAPRCRRHRAGVLHDAAPWCLWQPDGE